MASKGLTDEQRRLIEEKKRKALELRQSKLQSSSQGQGNPPNTKGLFATSSAIKPGSSGPAVSVKAPTHHPAPVNHNGGVKRNSQGSPKAAVQKIPSVSSYFGKPPVAPKTRIKIVLETDSRLEILFPFRDEIIKLVKSLKTSRFVMEGRKWTIHIDDYSNLINALQPLGTSVELDADSVPARVVSLIQSHAKYSEVEVDLLEKFDQEFLDRLFPFQREGIKFGIQRDGKCLLADDMGLGKTVQALGICGWYRTDWPVAIACPASVTHSWKNAIIRWLGHWVRENDIHMLDTKPPPYGPKFFIGSYERLGKWCDEFCRRRIPTMILDECHNIKSDSAKRTGAALKISKVTKHTILISGTPALSRPMELYTQLAALNEKLFTNKHEYGLRYCSGFQSWRQGKLLWDYRGSSNTDELKIILESTVMIRRLKSEVLKDLPPKSRVVINLPLKISDEDRVELEKIQNRVGNRTNFHTDNPDLMAWYRETGRLKVAAVIDYLERKIERKGKIIVFAHHKIMISAISDWLKMKNLKHIVICGETKSEIRQDLCDTFQHEESCRAAVVSINAAGVGITLTAANQVMFAELTWNPGALNQAEDRAHRIGQEENVVIEYLVSPNTCDERIWSILEKKLTVLGKVGLTKDLMKGNAQRDANQSLIEDYFSPKAKGPKSRKSDEGGTPTRSETPKRAAKTEKPDETEGATAAVKDEKDGYDSDIIFLDDDLNADDLMFLD